MLVSHEAYPSNDVFNVTIVEPSATPVIVTFFYATVAVAIDLLSESAVIDAFSGFVSTLNS